MLPNIFLSSVCRYVLSRVTQMCPDASNVIMNGAGWAGLGWAGLRLECGGWWRLADLGGRAVLVSVQSTVARVPPHSTQEPDA